MQLSQKLKEFYTDDNFKKLFFAFTAIILILMVSSSSHYGISWDEQVQSEYGERVLKFYTSFGKDTSYFDPQKAIHTYGPFFEWLSAIANHNYSGDPIERRHLLISLFGFLAIVFTGLTAREIGNWKSGVLAQTLIFFTPVFFGHSMFNSKDIPFAAGYIAAVYFIVRFLKTWPSPSKATIIGGILAIGVALSVRIGGLLLLIYTLIFLLIKLIREKEGVINSLMRNKKAVFKLFLMLGGGYMLAMLFWPFGLTNPIKHPLYALTFLSKYEFNSYNLFDGHWIFSLQVPWDYIPKWIWVTTPLFISVGILLLPIILIKWKAFNTRINGDLFLMILFTSVFPVLYIIYKKSNVYDGWRHTMFVYPPLVVCCASIWYGFIALLKSMNVYLKYAGTALLGVFVMEPALFMVNNHPLEAFYFSPTIGGTSGAFKKYEIDYYGTSIRNAVEWIAQHSDSLEKGPEGKIRVRCFYGEKLSVEHFVKRYNQLELVYANEGSLNWDYSIVQPVQAKSDSMLLVNWPPKGMVHQIGIDGAPVIAIARNYNKDIKAETAAVPIYDNTDVNALINTSVKYYQIGDFFNCVAACERVLMLDSNNYVALNNAASAFNNLYLFDEGIAYCERALKIKPDFDMARGNIQVANQRKQQAGPLSPTGLADNYLNLSAIFFNLHAYAKCIGTSEKAIKLRPNDAAAYNNICASYNALKQYEKAKRACEKAIAINPSFELAKTNLNLINRALGK